MVETCGIEPNSYNYVINLNQCNKAQIALIRAFPKIPKLAIKLKKCNNHILRLEIGWKDVKDKNKFNRCIF